MFGETQDKIKYKLNNCPFCGSVILKMERHIFNPNEFLKKRMVGYYVHCDNCGGSGPPNLNPEGAANHWNKSIPHPDPLEEAMKKEEDK